ncbi:hypothetical protein C8F04DRAFT_526962 [Mycena alexandri]|uniref:Uncharacterized protein n=1 Tax=Mycena alexandri TaxID=1745969 RepID=A0AAD6TER2_9AGAR|nr:hypothetical protein C8F04DRAFT_526962 [Mycena alexandri]
MGRAGGRSGLLLALTRLISSCLFIPHGRPSSPLPHPRSFLCLHVPPPPTQTCCVYHYDLFLFFIGSLFISYLNLLHMYHPLLISSYLISAVYDTKYDMILIHTRTRTWIDRRTIFFDIQFSYTHIFPTTYISLPPPSSPPYRPSRAELEQRHFPHIYIYTTSGRCARRATYIYSSYLHA